MVLFVWDGYLCAPGLISGVPVGRSGVHRFIKYARRCVCMCVSVVNLVNWGADLQSELPGEM